MFEKYFIKAKEDYFSVYIALSRHSGCRENSWKFCKPEMQLRVCITVMNSQTPNVKMRVCKHRKKYFLLNFKLFSSLTSSSLATACKNEHVKSVIAFVNNVSVSMCMALNAAQGKT